MRTSKRVRGIMFGPDDDTADEVARLETDYHLSMEVLRSIVDLTFPDLEVREPYMAALKRQADDAVKIWRKRLDEWGVEYESNKE